MQTQNKIITVCLVHMPEGTFQKKGHFCTRIMLILELERGQVNMENFETAEITSDHNEMF